MPAASEPPLVSLPHTWRPLGVRLAVAFFGLMLLIVCTAAWFGFDESVRERWTLLQKGTVIFLGACFAFVGWLLTRSRATAEMECLVVVNGLRRRQLEWEQIVSIHLPPGAPWATLDLSDGTTVSVIALQGSDGARARNAVRQLRALIDR